MVVYNTAHPKLVKVQTLKILNATQKNMLGAGTIIPWVRTLNCASTNA